MRYLVMESAPSYAIVLDEAGGFHKVPNLGYEVGQTLEHALVDEAAAVRADLVRVEDELAAEDGADGEEGSALPVAALSAADAPADAAAAAQEEGPSPDLSGVDPEADGAGDAGGPDHPVGSDAGKTAALELVEGGVQPTVAMPRAVPQPAAGGAPASRRRGPRRLASWVAAAACLCAVLLGGFAFWQTPLGTVHLQINPEVDVEVNRFDRVVGLTGANDDGEALVEGYWFYGKDAAAVAAELADRATEMGFLLEGGTVAVDVTSDDEGWRTALEDRVIADLAGHLGSAATVGRAADLAAQRAAEANEVVIELTPVEPEASAEPAAPVEQAPVQSAPAPAPSYDDDGDDDAGGWSDAGDGDSGYDDGGDADSGYGDVDDDGGGDD